MGYLLKPVKQELLSQALAKAQKLNKAQLAALQLRPPKNTTTGEERRHISARTLRGVELIPLDNIRYFIADHKYVTVYHTEGETLIDETLKGLEQEFADRFVRIHRNALVSIGHIESMEKATEGHYRLRLQGVPQQPVVSRRHVSKLRELLSQV